MLSMELIQNNKLEKGSKIMEPYYLEKNTILTFKQKLIRAHKFVVGSEFFYFTEAIENFTHGVEYGSNYYTKLGEPVIKKIITDFIKDVKKLYKLKENWKIFCQQLPFKEIFFESEKQGFLLEQDDNGLIYIQEVKENGVLVPMTFIIDPKNINPEDHDQTLCKTISCELAEEKYKLLNTVYGFDMIKLFSDFLSIQLYQLLMFINCRNINIINYKPKKSELIKIPKVLQKGFEYHIVKLTDTSIRYESLTDIETDLKRHLPSEIRAHIVRGHFKRRSTGVFWWNSFLRGHRKNGYIEKHYEVET